MRFRLIKLLNQLVTVFLPTNRLVMLEVPYQPAKPGDCGIACVAMVLKFKRTPHVDLESLITRYKNANYYQDPIGWKHVGLVEILRKNGATAKYKKYQTLLSLVNYLRQGKPLIASLKVPTIETISQTDLYQPETVEAEFAGHLVVLVGIENGSFILHDSRSVGIYTKNTVVPFRTFAQIFTGNCIVAD